MNQIIRDGAGRWPCVFDGADWSRDVAAVEGNGRNGRSSRQSIAIVIECNDGGKAKSVAHEGDWMEIREQ